MRYFDKSIENLLLDKAADPISQEEKACLNRIEQLDVRGFTETDVREEVINSLLQIVGYKKGQDYSVDREKHIRFLGKTHRYIDYSVTLWNKSFWLIEAKKPLEGKAEFGYEELSQAIEYAAHPDIDAALVVLCDGLKLEIFDREKDVESPILRVKISELTKSFQQIKKILAPIQIWFFYRRRILRAIDRAFENECNQNRLNEFKELVCDRLDQKRYKILENLQQSNLHNSPAYETNLLTASVDEIVDLHFFYSQSSFRAEAMANSLLNYCESSSPFHVIYKIFPDHVRDVNDKYYAHALLFLMKAEEINLSTNHMPSWLATQSDTSLTSATKNLIKYCLTHFHEDPSRKTILLASHTFRRILKILAIVLPHQKNLAEIRHLLTRHIVPEFSWEQIISSVERNSILCWDWLSLLATDNFVKSFCNESGKFNMNMAKQELQQLWQTEQHLLLNTPNYKELLNEHNFGEIYPTEATGVTYDNLGHHCLCVIKRNKKWLDYTIKTHGSELNILANIGSWAAREILDGDIDCQRERPNISLLADRFFFGDTAQATTTAKAYSP